MNFCLQPIFPLALGKEFSGPAQGGSWNRTAKTPEMGDIPQTGSGIEFAEEKIEEGWEWICHTGILIPNPEVTSMILSRQTLYAGNLHSWDARKI